MEDSQCLNKTNQKNEEQNLIDAQTYDIKNDWKFVSIVQFVNLFKNVLAVDSISTYELEVSFDLNFRQV